MGLAYGLGAEGPPTPRLHLPRLTCPVVELAGPATEVCRGGSSPEPPRK